MPKMRNGNTPTEMLANWIGRKCRNHNPLSELKLTQSAREATPRIYKGQVAEPNEVLLVADAGRNRIVYHNGQTAFEITINEIPMEEVEELETEIVAA